MLLASDLSETNLGKAPMNIRVIEGGASLRQRVGTDGLDSGGVAAEGRRRLREVGYERLAVKERVTGMQIPDAVRHYRLQVDYVVSVLSKLSPIPEDFASDIYWPKI
jgi:hypothetical protein